MNNDDLESLLPNPKPRFILNSDELRYVSRDFLEKFFNYRSTELSSVPDYVDITDTGGDYNDVAK